jgi:hypothetical protein
MSQGACSGEGPEIFCRSAAPGMPATMALSARTGKHYGRLRAMSLPARARRALSRIEMARQALQAAAAGDLRAIVRMQFICRFTVRRLAGAGCSA